MTWRAPRKHGVRDMRFDIPVDPDADTAREWAREELSKSEYQQGGGGSNWLERFMKWIEDFISHIGGGVGGAWGGWGTVGVVVIGLAIVALVLWLVVGPLRRSRGRGAAEEDLGDPTLSAADLIGRARAAADAEDWNTAVIEGYRAVIRALAEREVIDARPGMTALEAALVTAQAVPAMTSDISADADVFDAVRYGHLHATREHYEHVLATRNAAAAAKATVPA